MKLAIEKEIKIRFSEVDSMQIVWNGNYALFFEDARETFGKQYQMSYMDIFKHGYYTPLVEQHFYYKSPLRFGDNAKISIAYQDSLSPKLIFNYEIYNLTTQQLATTGQSTQVFVDLNHNLVLTTPDFMLNWKKKFNVL